MSGTSWAVLACLIALIAFKVFTGRRSPEQVAAMKDAVAKGALLLDVRSTGEFSSHHLEGAINIPVGTLQARLSELGDTSQTVIVYCASGVRSKAAVGTLKAGGFEDVHDLGSWRNWP